MINIEGFDSGLIKIGKKYYKNIGIYNIGYITVKTADDYENMNSVNSLYLIIGKAHGCIEENYGNKYLVFTSTDGNRKVVAKSTKLWDEIKQLMGHSMHSAKKLKRLRMMI